MDLDVYFNLVETPAFMFWAFWVSCVVLASVVVWGVFRAAGRGE